MSKWKYFLNTPEKIYKLINFWNFTYALITFFCVALKYPIKTLEILFTCSKPLKANRLWGILNFTLFLLNFSLKKQVNEFFHPFMEKLHPIRITNRGGWEGGGESGSCKLYIVMLPLLTVAALNAINLKLLRHNVRGLCSKQIQLFYDRS